MPIFEGTIRLEDGDGLESSLTVDSGRFVVEAGEYEIGNWAVEELSVERQNGEFRIGVEGEELVVSVSDPATFSESLGIKERKPKQRKKTKTEKVSKKRSREEANPPATAAADQTPGLLARIPTKWKLSGFVLVGLVVLGVLVPSWLALLLLLVGMVTLFLGIAARSESGAAFLPPPFFATTAASVGGIALVLLAVVIIAIT